MGKGQGSSVCDTVKHLTPLFLLFLLEGSFLLTYFQRWMLPVSMALFQAGRKGKEEGQKIYPR